ncbi:MAG: peroxide stress protein YaaA [Bacteroidia bacterium]|nr:peroxide stress protein YaaA [Bacteroidia bacterium]
MLIIISPAKTLDFEPVSITSESTSVMFQEEADYLIGKLRKLSVRQISKLMDLSKNLSELNAERYANWNSPLNLQQTKQAVLAFKGEVYVGLEAENYSREDLAWTQQHLRILSGLYGVLRPLDMIQPYRLEMGIPLKITAKKTGLYQYWGNLVTEALNDAIAAQGDEVLINLASQEYFKVVNPKVLKARMVTPVFKDWKSGQYKVLSFFAKKARGLMSSYILLNRLENPEDLKSFSGEGYAFNEELSAGDEWVFTRRQE